MFLAMQDSTPFAWAVDHIQLIGWPAVCIAIYKFARFLDKIQHRAEAVEDNIGTLTENHFPHIQNSLESIDKTLQRQEVRWESWLTAQAAQHKKD
jgi:hypothetical protein